MTAPETLITPSNEQDLTWMRLALAQAQEALYLTSPNPRVGCVIVGAGGDLLGKGHTQKVGFSHAEVMALKDVQSRGLSAKGARVYVTLEPCSHTGRTPPCCDALIQAQVAQVFVSLLDPNPLVSGQGVARLQAHGIEVQVGLLGKEAQEMNIGFFQRMNFKRPWFWSKIASSLDGQTALENGVSQWITSADARQDGHHWRARSCAILTGIGTLLQDQPRLDVRGITTPRQPKLVVVDSQLQFPLNAQVLEVDREVIIYCALVIDPSSHQITHIPHIPHAVHGTSPSQSHHALSSLHTPTQGDATQRMQTLQTKLDALRLRGVQVVGQSDPVAPQLGPITPPTSPTSPTSPTRPLARKVDLAFMARDLGLREINEVHIEAGARLNGAMLEAQLIDELLIYLAPKWLGPGRPMSVMPALSDLHQALELEWQSVDPMGVDLRIRARVKRAAPTPTDVPSAEQNPSSPLSPR
jgi:diaminohydroxyphosphoribosylaminopyrimidine deaminase/5-amino-6-(5-phosphoribosylamino)uracil reductase